MEEVDDENEYDEGSEEEVQESTVQRIDDAQVQEIPPEPVPMQEEFEIPEEAAQADVVPEATAAVEETPMYREEEPEASVETPEEHASAIKQVVTGATLEEALAQGAFFILRCLTVVRHTIRKHLASVIYDLSIMRIDIIIILDIVFVVRRTACIKFYCQFAKFCNFFQSGRKLLT